MLNENEPFFFANGLFFSRSMHKSTNFEPIERHRETVIRTHTTQLKWNGIGIYLFWERTISYEAYKRNEMGFFSLSKIQTENTFFFSFSFSFGFDVFGRLLFFFFLHKKLCGFSFSLFFSFFLSFCFTLHCFTPFNITSCNKGGPL